MKEEELGIESENIIFKKKGESNLIQLIQKNYFCFPPLKIFMYLCILE